MMYSAAAVMFFVAVGVLVYTYAFYPLLLALMSLCAGRSGQVAEFTADWPTVSILISAHNEERHIACRVENLLTLDYPRDKVEILIGSDASTDRTEELIRRYADSGVQLYSFKERSGKPAVLNRIVPLARGDVLVFSDANSIFAADALKRLSCHFADQGVGGVCGRLIFGGDTAATHEGLYWSLETYLKERESRLDSCLGANGAIYAIRKSCWPGIADETIADDFVVAMRVRENGLRVVYDRDAIAVEDLPRSISQEVRRRSRIGAGDFQALFLCWRSLLPWPGRIFHAIAFWSHKVLRWFAPFVMIMVLTTNIALRSRPAYAMVLMTQCAFYALALGGTVLRDRRCGVCSLPRYFVSLNLALLFGFCRFVTGTQEVAWKRTGR